MSISVEENVLRCFRKFGDKVADRTAIRQGRWKNSSFYRPMPEEAEKKAGLDRSAPGPDQPAG